MNGRTFARGSKDGNMIQVYTGKGKGKTTAAMGLALRATGQGMRVRICQFLKGGGGEPSGEIKALERCIGSIQVRRFDQIPPMFSEGRVDLERLKRDVKEDMAFVKGMMEKEEVDLLILDEINVVLANGWYPLADFLDLLETKPDSMEVVLTGRGAPAEVCRRADLVTEMVEVKHPFQRGIPSRRGIEY